MNSILRSMTDSRTHTARGDVEAARADFDTAIAIFEEVES